MHRLLFYYFTQFFGENNVPYKSLQKGLCLSSFRTNKTEIIDTVNSEQTSE